MSLTTWSEVIKACPTSDNNFLVVLDEQHMLSLWDISSLTMVAFWHFLAVDDFLLVSTSDVKTNTASSEEEHKIIILTKPANSQETIYFTEAVQKFDDDNEDDTVTLRIRCLTEALPENRFYRLLHKHQFDAAEKFAKQFKLDTELVYKVKANTLLDKVSQWSSSQDHEDFDFEELKQCLSKIQEDDYVINCCLQAVFPTVEETYTILQYARERASKRDKSSGMICHPHLHNEILGVLNKLVTFENAYGIQQFSGSRWHSFQHADLLDEVKSCFGQGEVSSAVIIWRRHQDLLASWLDQRARKMELSEKKGWPANALELVRVLPAPTYDSSAKKDSNTTSTKESGLARLAELVHGLSELQELHEKYSCRIGLAEYTEETTKTIVFRLLDGVKAAELLPQAMKKYIAP
ncbi:Kinetochore-associated protein 1, partial [Exaiptasia diaphana]